MQNFLPMTKDELKARGIDRPDFVLISGDAYVDHPSFGPILIARYLESKGYTVGVIAQPDWHSVGDFRRLGEPKLAFLVSAGNMDSMVNHYSVNRVRRREDLYSPGGKGGKRPDRATVVYSNRIREAYPKTPIIIGGIEASLRRFAHYDYWSDKVRHSILDDSGADLLVYGMGERAMGDIAECLSSGMEVGHIHHIPGTCYMTGDVEGLLGDDVVFCPSYEEVAADKKKYARAYGLQYREQDDQNGNILVQKQSKQYLIQNPPAAPLSEKELGDIYDLPFQYAWHPSYDKLGGIPALNEVKFSLTHVRGCFGSCNFCAIGFHQGRKVTSRSHDSVIKEAKKMIAMPDFRGTIHDVGGPTANFRDTACQKQKKLGVCKDRTCLGFEPCPNLKADHSDYLSLLRKLRALPGVKHVFVRSGIRFDYLEKDEKHSREFLEDLAKYHVSGHLKVAPEHAVDAVLRYMDKPTVAVFDRFVRAFRAASKKVGKEQYVLPYFISSHPGSTIENAIQLAEYMNKNHYHIEQVQDFYPTPGTVSTTMFYTGLDPRTLKPVYIPKTREEKQKQRALLQYWDVKNYDTVKATLLTAGRGDLIGFGPEYLIPPRLPKKLEEKGQQAREGAARKNTDRGNKPGKPASGKPTPGRGEQPRNPGKPSAKSGSKPFAKKR